MADFDTPFGDAGGVFGSGYSQGFGPGPAEDALAARRRAIVDALLSGETGVQFESLALFAEPLFTLYEHDPAEAFTLRTDPAGADDETVALMETARVLWAFFSLSASSRAHRRPALIAQLVGGEATSDDLLDLDGVIEAAEVHWQALLPEEIEMAQDTGHPVLGFDDLVHHPAFRIDADPDPAHAGFGEGELSESEARALFAQPLLEAPEVMLDAEAFDSALERADAYWDAARTGTAPEAVARKLASGDGAPDVAEAERMLGRYAELFTR